MMFDVLLLISIGLFMGTFGGLLGIGGSAVMIPAMMIFYKGHSEMGIGTQQHFVQAAAMICNFFVAASAVTVHGRGRVLVRDIVKWLVPAGIVGILIGVWVSNINLFGEAESRNLTRIYACFMVYAAFYNVLKLVKPGNTGGGPDGFDISGIKKIPGIVTTTGFITGFFAGLLGIGGGPISTPMQQFFMRMPLKRAIANSTAVIAGIALIGAVYKNITLSQHGVSSLESIKVSAIIIPTAIVGGFIGGKLMHILPKNIVRVVFIGLMIAASFKMFML